ncbi:hypothetical protein CY34DRAFT_811293 [Suillus luteus UH-Slu-Lm8-n1]|uniref:Uncharacterized protein n=1 Tax=Suillus luteus UH-Slu-Lm8-n1 TaxID=930992 RepID=A0A0D0A423_9AGAM|nr:hypothetical protein CY34DRAFT_811293 [Suillus luteus UH-Slu-Lm8-n1]
MTRWMTTKFYHDGDTLKSLFFLGFSFRRIRWGSIGVVSITLVVVALHCLSDAIQESH